MNNFFSSIGALFTTLRNIGTEEYRGIKNTLIYLLVTFYILCLFQWLFNGHGIVRLLGYVLCIGSMLLLFRVPRLIRLAGLGEILETFRLTQENPDNGNDSIPDILENQLISAIWNMTEKLFFLHSMSCLLIPVLPIKNNPEIIPVFTITAVAVFLFIWRTGGNWVRPIGLIVSLLFLAIHLSFLFPQPKFYFNELSEKIPVSMIPSGPAEMANEVAELRSKQRGKILQEVYKNALEWQQKNPSRDLPEDIKLEIAAAKKGLTLKEYKKQLKAEAELKAKAEKERGGKKTLIETVNTDGSRFPRNFQSFLLPGEYNLRFNPIEAETGAKISIRLPNGQVEERLIENNFVSIGKEEKGCGIKTTTPAMVRVLAP